MYDGISNKYAHNSLHFHLLWAWISTANPRQSKAPNAKVQHNLLEAIVNEFFIVRKEDIKLLKL